MTSHNDLRHMFRVLLSSLFNKINIKLQNTSFDSKWIDVMVLMVVKKKVQFKSERMQKNINTIYGYESLNKLEWNAFYNL